MANLFGRLFKKYRFRAELYTLAEFGEALAGEGYIYENSIFSRWQKNNRIPKDRKLLLSIVKIFINKKGINSVNEINSLLESAGQGYITEQELKDITNFSPFTFKLKSPKNVVKFIAIVGKSKQLLRSGWLREKIKDPESVAEHSFRVSVLAMVLADHLGLDKEKLIQMAIVHDLGEVLTGDIVWSRGAVLDMKKKAEKEELEKKGIGEIFKLVEKSDNYRKLFGEMLEGKTPEAKIFWQLDKLEMAFQALEYEKQYHKKLDEFFVNANLQIHTPFLRAILLALIKQRVSI